jgi:hypothetical protein
MKKKLSILWIGITLSAFIALNAGLVLTTSGCKITSQRAAYNTLAGVGKTTHAAVDAYFAAVVAGAVKTNGVPKVATAFAQFQTVYGVAVLAAKSNPTNAIAPANVVLSAANVTATITAAKQ